MRAKTNTLLRLARLEGRLEGGAPAYGNKLPQDAMDFLAEGRRVVNPFNMRFLKAMTRTTNQGCWEWCGARCTDGYGMVVFFGKRWGAHRASFYLTYGINSHEDYILHKCDNPACCNPSHLYAGNPRMNAIDAVVRGRKSDVRLSEFEVEEIKREYAYTDASQSEIAHKHRINQSHVSRIISGHVWNHETKQ